MAEEIQQDIRNLMIYNDLITSLITLKVILVNIDKISIVKDLEINNKIRELEVEKTGELEWLQQELRVKALRNRFLRKSNEIEEEIE